jgi:glycolate oxidase FAD binding subunit
VAADVKSAQREFGAILGEDRLADDPAACAACAVDGKVPWLVLYPSTAEEVAAVLKSAAGRGLAVIPFRNRTKLDIGNPPERYDIGLSLKEMNNVWQYEPADLTITAEPGMKFGDFQHLAAGQQLWLPLDPAGGAKASLGGILATNASGALRQAYGSARDMVLGMKIATTEGTIIKTGGRVVKNVAGYDLGKLLLGSYGTLGVIVEASLKLYPLPARRATFVLRTGNLGIARDVRRRILGSPLALLRLVLLDAAAARRLRAGTPLAAESREPEMWMEGGGSERVLERTRAVLEGLGREVGASTEAYPAEDAESVWSHASDFRRWIAETHPGAVVLRVSLPISRSEEFLSAAQQEAENAKTEMAAMSLAGVGAAHVALLNPAGAGDGEKLIRRLRQLAEELGGALVVEQCPLEWKARLDVWGEPRDDCGIMRKVKVAWDSKRILAPGRMIGRI